MNFPASFQDFWLHGMMVGPLDIQPRHIVFMIVLMVVFATALWHLLFRPILRILDSREARILSGSQAQAEAKRQQHDRLEEIGRRLQQARREAVQVREKEKAEVSREREGLLGAARGQAGDVLAAERARIEAESARAVGEVRTAATSIAAQIAGLILGRKAGA